MSGNWRQLCPQPFFRRLVSLSVGLVVFGFSLALLVRADLGLDPWDVFHQGVARTVDRRLGLVLVLTSIVILLLWIPLKQRPGIGTVANAIAVGVVFEASIAVLPGIEAMGPRFAMLLGGIGLNALATGLYVGAGLGPGPRDGLMTGMAARGWSLGWVRTGIEATVLVVGWLLGGTVGIGTVLFAFTIGPLVHVALPLLTIEVETSSSGFPEHIPAEQLDIRTWRRQDGPAMEQLIASSLDHLRPWMAWARHEPITVEQRWRLFTRWESYRASGRGAVYAVFHGSELIGGCALHRRVGSRGLDVGYWLGVNATGRGHASAIVGALIETAVSLEDIDFLQISHDAANTASGAVAERLGFTAIATPDGLPSRTWRLDTSNR